MTKKRNRQPEWVHDDVVDYLNKKPSRITKRHVLITCTTIAITLFVYIITK